MLINNNYHHKLYDGLASCLTKLSEFDQAIEVYKQIFQREEGKKKWDAQRSIKFVNKLKRKKPLVHCRRLFRVAHLLQPAPRQQEVLQLPMPPVTVFFNLFLNCRPLLWERLFL